MSAFSPAKVERGRRQALPIGQEHSRTLPADRALRLVPAEATSSAEPPVPSLVGCADRNLSRLVTTPSFLSRASHAPRAQPLLMTISTSTGIDSVCHQLQEFRESFTSVN